MSERVKIVIALCMVVFLVAVALTMSVLARVLIERSGYKLSWWQQAAIGATVLLIIVP